MNNTMQKLVNDHFNHAASKETGNGNSNPKYLMGHVMEKIKRWMRLYGRS